MARRAPQVLLSRASAPVTAAAAAAPSAAPPATAAAASSSAFASAAAVIDDEARHALEAHHADRLLWQCRHRGASCATACS